MGGGGGGWERGGGDVPGDIVKDEDKEDVKGKEVKEEGWRRKRKIETNEEGARGNVNEMQGGRIMKGRGARENEQREKQSVEE